MTAYSQAIDQQLEGIPADEIAMSWRLICGMMLVQTVVAYRKGAVQRREDADAKRAARRWIDGGGGLITFEDCCDALDLDLVSARTAIKSAADWRQTGAINRLSAGVKRCR